MRFWYLGKKYPLNTKLILQNSVFGHIISGNVPTSNGNKIHCGLIKDSIDLNKLLRDFRKIDILKRNWLKIKKL